MSNYFIDQSGWQGVKEFNTPLGELQAHRISGGYQVYEKHGNAWRHVKVIRSSKKLSCAEIYEKLSPPFQDLEAN